MTMDIRDAFTQQPSFTTERLLVRPLDRSDVEAIFAIKSDPQVAGAYGNGPHRSVEESREWVEGRLAARGKRDSMFWVFVPSGERRAVGSCCFWHFDLESRCAELGYELHRAYWGKGMMTEALAPVLAYGFDGLGLNRIEACPLAENAASNALLRSFGFRHEGTLRQRVGFRERYMDQHYYGLLKSEWNPRAVG
jgi:ribosomal-protein-alanine N-acetyltransferase